MRCPLDKHDMIVVEYKKIELDYCLECSGVWFDSGELDLLMSTLSSLEKQANSNPVPPEKAEVHEAKRNCPVCGKKMDKIWLGKSPRVLVDSCSLGDGLWFDGGELQQVLNQAISRAGTENIISFLGEVFPVNLKERRK